MSARERDFFDEDALAVAGAWRRAGRGVALATVIQTWGSSPRPLGSQLAVADDGRLHGSVSGGCVEAAVITEAREVIRTGQARLLSFGVAANEAFEVGLPCGGRIRVFVEPVD